MARKRKRSISIAAGARPRSMSTASSSAEGSNTKVLEQSRVSNTEDRKLHDTAAHLAEIDHNTNSVDLDRRGKGKKKKRRSLRKTSVTIMSSRPMVTAMRRTYDTSGASSSTSAAKRERSSPSSSEQSPKEPTKKRSKTRRGKRRRRSASRSPSSTFDDSMDPITREQLTDNVFEYKRPNGRVVKYNADTLVRYMLATGDFCEPESRIPFTDCELKSLDALTRSAGLKLESVHKAKHEKNRYEASNFRRDALLGLERCAGELVCQMLNIIEEVTEGNEAADDAEATFLCQVFPMFLAHFESIRSTDPTYAKQCLAQYKTFIAGPPNKPTHNTAGLKDVVMNFFEELSNEEISGRDFGL